jgi:DNA-binding NarL/FixJ family response regulator
MQRELRARTILLATDVRLLIEALRWAIARGPHYAVIGAGMTSAEVLKLTAAMKPDILLAESWITRGAGLIGAVARASPTTKTVAFGVANDRAEILACIEAGVCGYVLRDAKLEDMFHALDAAVREEVLCPPDIVACAFARIANLATQRQAPTHGLRLSDRQTQILSLIAEGLTNKEIAGRLGIELATVKNHVHALLTNMGVHRRSQAAAKYRFTHSPSLQRAAPARSENHEY